MGRQSEAVVERVSAWKAGQLQTGWGGYFTASAWHITNVERAAWIGR